MYMKRKILAIFVKIAFFFSGYHQRISSWTGTDHKTLIKLSHQGDCTAKPTVGSCKGNERLSGSWPFFVLLLIWFFWSRYIANLRSVFCFLFLLFFSWGYQRKARQKKALLCSTSSISKLLYIKLRDVLCDRKSACTYLMIVLLCSRMTHIYEDACALWDPIVNHNALGASTLLLVKIIEGLCDAQSAYV